MLKTLIKTFVKTFITSAILFGGAALAFGALSYPQVPLRTGVIKVQQSNGQEWSMTATTTTAIGNGNTLMWAYNLAPCGSTLTLSSSTNPYNINTSVLDLTKQGSCNPALSIQGERGQYPEIDGANKSGTGIYEIIQPGNGSIVQDLTIRATQVFPSDFGFPIYIATDNATIVIRNVKAFGSTDGIYAFNGNVGVNLTVDNFIGTCRWDCGTFDMPLSTTTIRNSSFNIVTPPVTAGVLRPLFFARGTYYLYNVRAIGNGGTSRISSIQIDPSATAQDSVTMYSGVLSATGAATSYEIDNQGSGSFNVFSGVQRTIASTTGTVSYPDQATIAQSLGSASSTLANGITLTSGCFVMNGACITGGSGGSPTGVLGSVQFNNGSGGFGSSAKLIWDTVLNALGVGTSSPYATLSVEQGTEDTSFAVSNQGSSTPSFVVKGVNKNGTVGIGTNNPALPLEVTSNSTLGGISVVSSGSGTAPAFGLMTSPGNTSPLWDVRNNGDMVSDRNSAGGNVSYLIQNDNNSNAASTAELLLKTGGASSGDPFILFGNNVTNWSIGLDNSDSDQFKVSNSTALGTNDYFKILTTGVTSITPQADAIFTFSNTGSSGTAELSIQAGVVANAGQDITIDASQNFILENTESGDLIWKTSGGEKARLKNNGNFGIGSTTPGTLLSLGNTGWNFVDNGTSTGQKGLNITAGCYALNGTCISGGGGSSLTVSGVLGSAQFNNGSGGLGSSAKFIWDTGNNLLNVGSLYATATTSTSTFAGPVAIGTSTSNSLLEVNGSFHVESANPATSTSMSFEFCTANNIQNIPAVGSSNITVTLNNSSKCPGKSLVLNVTAPMTGVIASTTFVAGTNSGTVVWDGGVNPGNSVLPGSTDRFVFTSMASSSSSGTATYISADLTGTF